MTNSPFSFVLIFGPPASGKMTVGQELQKLTEYKLFYNHMSLELVNQFFDFGTPNFRKLDKKIRFDIFKAVANSAINGLIFTLVWDLNDKGDEEYIDEIVHLFKDRNPKIYFVELQCTLEERLIRNKHEHRLALKPTKRNVDASEKRLLNNESKYRMNTLEGEIPYKSIFKINNTHLAAREVAEKIVAHFGLE